jgi:aspartyl-tRNA(Asn)/glutamyl-tRNA(Gln) amidotransferase subunit C
MSSDIIDDNKIDKIAKLAKIAISDEQKPLIKEQLINIVNWFDKLNEVNVDNIEPLINVNEMSLTMNDDEIIQHNNISDILKNAPQAKYDYFTVPKVIEE